MNKKKFFLTTFAGIFLAIASVATLVSYDVHNATGSSGENVETEDNATDRYNSLNTEEKQEVSRTLNNLREKVTENKGDKKIETLNEDVLKSDSLIEEKLETNEVGLDTAGDTNPDTLQEGETVVVESDIPRLQEPQNISLPPSKNVTLDKVPTLYLKDQQFQGAVRAFNKSSNWVVLESSTDSKMLSFVIDSDSTVLINVDGNILDYNESDPFQYGRSVKITKKSDSVENPYEALVVEFLN